MPEYTSIKNKEYTVKWSVTTNKTSQNALSQIMLVRKVVVHGKSQPKIPKISRIIIRQVFSQENPSYVTFAIQGDQNSFKPFIDQQQNPIYYLIQDLKINVAPCPSPSKEHQLEIQLSSYDTPQHLAIILALFEETIECLPYALIQDIYDGFNLNYKGYTTEILKIEGYDQMTGEDCQNFSEFNKVIKLAVLLKDHEFLIGHAKHLIEHRQIDAALIAMRAALVLSYSMKPNEYEALNYLLANTLFANEVMNLEFADPKNRKAVLLSLTDQSSNTVDGQSPESKESKEGKEHKEMKEGKESKDGQERKGDKEATKASISPLNLTHVSSLDDDESPPVTSLTKEEFKKRRLERAFFYSLRAGKEELPSNLRNQIWGTLAGLFTDKSLQLNFKFDPNDPCTTFSQMAAYFKTHVMENESIKRDPTREVELKALRDRLSEEQERLGRVRTEKDALVDLQRETKARCESEVKSAREQLQFAITNGEKSKLELAERLAELAKLRAELEAVKDKERFQLDQISTQVRVIQHLAAQVPAASVASAVPVAPVASALAASDASPAAPVVLVAPAASAASSPSPSNVFVLSSAGSALVAPPSDPAQAPVPALSPELVSASVSASP